MHFLAKAWVVTRELQPPSILARLTWVHAADNQVALVHTTVIHSMKARYQHTTLVSLCMHSCSYQRHACPLTHLQDLGLHPIIIPYRCDIPARNPMEHAQAEGPATHARLLQPVARILDP